MDKLDTPVKVTAGAVNDYVYRVRYGDAMSISCSIQALYGQLSGFASQVSIMSCMGLGAGGLGGGGFGGGGFGGGGFGPGGGVFNGGFGGGFGGVGAAMAADTAVGTAEATRAADTRNRYYQQQNTATPFSPQSTAANQAAGRHDRRKRLDGPVSRKRASVRWRAAHACRAWSQIL